MVPAVAGPFRATCDFDTLDELGDVIAACEHGIEPENLLGTFLDLRPLTEDLATDRRVTTLHVKWGAVAMERAAANPLPPLRAGKRSGKIRLGLLSSDLRSHAVAKFLKPIFEHLDRTRFSLHCYTPWDLPADPVQAEMRRQADQFSIVAQITDREAASLVREDAIDILFDLNGATQNSRIEVLAYRAAPVQITWLGYGATTGMSTVDYTLMDRYVAPTESGLWTETPLLMESSWVCFADYPDEPIAEPPLARNGFVTFGTMNAVYKITPQMVAVWSRIMNAVEGSRMLFVRPEFASVVGRANLAKEFAKHGIKPERLFFIANQSGQFLHLSHYNEIDIALDTYPAVGGTTSCDTLWMGVPVIGRYGPNMHQRLNHAIMNHCGMGDLSVATADEYFEKAVWLASEGPLLAEMRRGLRDVVKQSPLYDAAGFVVDFQDRMMELVARHGLR
jgi:predicted O-linked N-acetylglucosamine transferase (SPINDLY family)